MWSMETFVSSLTPWTHISRRVSLRNWTARLQRCRRNWKTSEHAMPSSIFASGSAPWENPLFFQASHGCGLNFPTTSIGATFWWMLKEVSPLTGASWELSQSQWSMTLSCFEMTIGTVLGAKHLFLVHTEWLHSDKYFQRNVFRQRTTSACIQEWLLYV